MLYGVGGFVIALTIKPHTCVCFFGSGATDLETLLTSLWTSVNILFRFSTFSFLALLICKVTTGLRQASQLCQKLKCFSFPQCFLQLYSHINWKNFQILHVWALLWLALLCSCASSSCLRLEKRSSAFSPSACSLPCCLHTEQKPAKGDSFHCIPSIRKFPSKTRLQHWPQLQGANCTCCRCFLKSSIDRIQIQSALDDASVKNCLWAFALCDKAASE